MAAPPPPGEDRTRLTGLLAPLSRPPVEGGLGGVGFPRLGLIRGWQPNPYHILCVTRPSPHRILTGWRFGRQSQARFGCVGACEPLREDPRIDPAMEFVYVIPR